MSAARKKSTKGRKRRSAQDVVQQKAFAQRLIALREKKGWNKNALSEASGVKRESIGKYENAQGLPDASNLQKLCVALEVSADYMLGLSNET